MSDSPASPTSTSSSPSPSTSMPPINRSVGRNVHIYDANHPNTVLGGLVLTNGVTNGNFYSMVEILIIFTSAFLLRDEGGTEIKKDNRPLQPGKYYIVATGSFEANNEIWLARTISLQTGSRVQSFRDAVRSRDRRCVISGKVAPPGAFQWLRFQAAHIFPLAREGYWKQYNYGRWISLPPESGGTINSVQNGLLLESGIHRLFDAYAFSINPDDNYKIVCFGDVGEDIGGKYLSQELLDDPRRPVDELLGWHFRQAVLANMRGAGEPVFEFDFPPGSDIVGDILSGPKAAERMEFELFNRLAGQVEISN